MKDANAEGRAIGTSDDGALRPNVYQDGELTARHQVAPGAVADQTANGAPDSYVMEPLSIPEDTITVEVGGIAEDGTVAWPVDGERFELLVPEGTVVRPASIVAAGTTVAGDVEAKDGTAWSVVWDLAEGTAEPVEVSRKLDHVIDVNAEGMLVGTTTAHTPGLASVKAGDLKLPTLTGEPNEFNEQAWAVNADGTNVAGVSLNERGEPQTVTWSCS